jgi:hypothetical protein
MVQLYHYGQQSLLFTNITSYFNTGKMNYAVTRVSLTRIAYNANDKEVNAVSITRTSAYARWQLRGFSDQCEDIFYDRTLF